MNKKASPRPARVAATFALAASAVCAAAPAQAYQLSDEQKRIIAALLTAPKAAPGIGIGVPTGFGAGQGQVFAAIGGTTTEKANGRGEYDGSASVGFGLGDANKYAALELQANIISLTNNAPGSSFGEEGSFSAKISRVLSPTTGIAVGAENLGTWGNALKNTDPSLYVAMTHVASLSPENPFNPHTVSFTVGLGNERFEDIRDGKSERDIGLFASAALAVTRQASVIAEYNGNYINLGVSYVPMPKYPLTISLSAINAESVLAADGGTATGDREFGGSIGYSWTF